MEETMGVVKLTDMKKKAYCELLTQGTLRGVAAEKLGVNRHTVTEAAKRDPEFAQAIEDAVETKHENVEDTLYQRALAGNITAMIFYLSNRVPDRWMDVKNIAVKGQFSGALSGFSKEDFAKQLVEYDNVFKMLAATDTPAIEGEVVEGEVIEEPGGDA
jgi:hypothetical protein